MTAAARRAQDKVTTEATHLAEVHQLVDPRRPNKARRQSFDDAMRRIKERYSEAIRLLGEL